MFPSLHSQLTLSLPVLRCTDYTGREARNSLQNAGFQTPHLPSFIAARAHGTTTWRDLQPRSRAQFRTWICMIRDIDEWARRSSIIVPDWHVLRAGRRSLQRTQFSSGKPQLICVFFAILWKMELSFQVLYPNFLGESAAASVSADQAFFCHGSTFFRLKCLSSWLEISTENSI